MTAKRLQIVVQNQAAQSDAPAKALLKAWATEALGDADGELTLRIVGEAESAELNQRYRDRAGATNVLAFPAGELPALDDEPAPLGDVVICAPVVAAEAAAQYKSLDAHWAHIVIHGCLHLAGYDHLDDADAERMESRERELLAGLGFTDPYAPVAD